MTVLWLICGDQQIKRSVVNKCKSNTKKGMYIYMDVIRIGGLLNWKFGVIWTKKNQRLFKHEF